MRATFRRWSSRSTPPPLLCSVDHNGEPGPGA